MRVTARSDVERARVQTVIARLNRAHPDARLALHFSSPFELLIALILAAQCTDERVNEVTGSVLFKKYEGPDDYVRVPAEELEEDIRPTGFFRNKTKAIQRCCQQLIEQFGGRVPDRLDDLVSLAGVGRKTANIVLGNAFGQPAIGVDTHVMRLSQRLGFSQQEDPDKIEAELTPLVPKKELDGDIGDTHVGLQARLMSQSLRKLTAAIAKSRTSVIFINQIREKIGVMFGSPETTPGGRALKFYTSCRIDVRRIGQLKEGEEVVGQRVRAKVVKNKVAPPFRIAEFDMMHTDGISYEGDLLDMGMERKLIGRTGAWFRYGDLQLGQGKEKARLFLKENPQLAQELKEKILAAGGHGQLAKSFTGDDGDADTAE